MPSCLFLLFPPPHLLWLRGALPGGRVAVRRPGQVDVPDADGDGLIEAVVDEAVRGAEDVLAVDQGAAAEVHHAVVGRREERVGAPPLPDQRSERELEHFCVLAAYGLRTGREKKIPSGWEGEMSLHESM